MVWAAPLMGQTPAASLQALEEEVAAERSAFEALEARFERELQAIEELKQRRDGISLEDAQLREALARANALAESLASADAELRASQSALAAAQRARLEAIDDERLRLEGSLASNPSRIGQTMAALNALARERAALHGQMQRAPSRVSLEELLAYVPTTHEEMLLAADELDDHVARLERELEALQRELRSEAIAARIQARDRDFGREDELLGGGAGRQRSERPVASESGGTATSGGAGAQDEGTNVASPPRGGVADGPTSAAGEEMGAADPGFDSAEESSAPGDASPNDAPMGGGLDDDAESEEDFSFPAVAFEPEPSVGSAERVDGGAAATTFDPTVLEGAIGDDGERSGRAGRAPGGLAALEDALERRIAEIRLERDRLRRAAAALD